jgi:hypothetical protein
MGTGIDDALNCRFTNIISFESYEPFYTHSKNKYSSIDNVKVVNGYTQTSIF